MSRVAVLWIEGISFPRSLSRNLLHNSTKYTIKHNNIPNVGLPASYCVWETNSLNTWGKEGVVVRVACYWSRWDGNSRSGKIVTRSVGGERERERFWGEWGWCLTWTLSVEWIITERDKKFPCSQLNGTYQSGVKWSTLVMSCWYDLGSNDTWSVRFLIPFLCSEMLKY